MGDDGPGAERPKTTNVATSQVCGGPAKPFVATSVAEPGVSR